MTDKVINSQDGYPKRLLDMGDGTYAPMGASADLIQQVIPDYAVAADLAAAWGGFAGVDTANGDFLTLVSGLNGQVITALSGSPLTTGESVIAHTAGITQPGALEVAASFVRTGISFATASLYANASTGPDTVPAPINIVSAFQSNSVQGAAYSAVAGTIITIVMDVALPTVGSNQAVFIGDWVNVTGLVENRLNYPNLCINYISPDRKTICAGFSDEVALPSLAIATVTPTLGTAKVNCYNNFSGARDAFGLRLTGTTATSAAIVSIFGGDDNQVSGTLLGDHRVSIGSTAPIYVAGANFGQYEIKATNRFRLECTPSCSLALDKSEQAIAAWSVRDNLRESVKPASGAFLHPRFRLYKPINMSRPIAKIVKAEKLSASSTATVTTDVAHNLVTGMWVTVKGARDFTTNYPPLTVPAQVTVLTSTTFTITWGAAAIATTFGGSVIMANGGRDQPGIISQTVQNVQFLASSSDNWLQVTGSAAWSGLNPGDYINLHGVRDNTGADLICDGAWEVANISTTLMLLKPVYNIFNARVSPDPGAIGSTACGGTVILRPTLRAHDLMLESWDESRTRIDGQGQTRLDKALPVQLLNVAAVTVNSGTVTTVTTVSTVAAVTTQGTPVAPATPYFVNSAATTNGALILTGSSGMCAFYASNIGATAAFVKLYNKATGPTVGTDVPEMVIPVPAAVAGVPGFVELAPGFNAYRFPLGLGIAITGAVADTDTTAVAAGQVKVKLSRTV